MNDLAQQRLHDTMSIVEKEVRHLKYSVNQLFSEGLTRQWIETLDVKPGDTVILEAFRK